MTRPRWIYAKVYPSLSAEPGRTVSCQSMFRTRFCHALFCLAVTRITTCLHCDTSTNQVRVILLLPNQDQARFKSPCLSHPVFQHTRLPLSKPLASMFIAVVSIRLHIIHFFLLSPVDVSQTCLSVIVSNKPHICVFVCPWNSSLKENKSSLYSIFL